MNSVAIRKCTDRRFSAWPSAVAAFKLFYFVYLYARSRRKHVPLPPLVQWREASLVKANFIARTINQFVCLVSLAHLCDFKTSKMIAVSGLVRRR